ncbi:MAG: helix-turn-helix domain-containing protein [Myxococcales bacterium]|nr:helix-turn-helix domain-containing protein [Myxococcales bacterium]MCB9547246.1 helix-turn-helix domain-containing protein [Myxococcales bacterium]
MDASRLADDLATNLRALRAASGLTQAQLASRAAVPRSTLANLEVGGGNPTLAVLARLAGALRVSIEELVSAPQARCRIFRRGALPEEGRAPGARVQKLLPDPVPGMAIDRMELAAGATLAGVPHRPGTREYLYCERGRLILSTGGERLELEAGDVAVFQGDRPHAYANRGTVPAVGFSVVAYVPTLG